MSEKQRDINEIKAERMNQQHLQQSVFFMVKIRVTRKMEMDGDWEMQKLFYTREIRKALEQLGDVKNIAVFM